MPLIHIDNCRIEGLSPGSDPDRIVIRGCILHVNNAGGQESWLVTGMSDDDYAALLAEQSEPT